MTFPLMRHAVGMAAVLLFAGYAAAQARLPEVVVTGNPLGAGDGATPVHQLSGDGLLLRGRSTLGELLDGTPGVSSTYFGPNASRPVIRGLDGDRIRILSNSGANQDASGLSYDHAVATDPISTERVEVLRGPGTLLYGGSAAGGVINLIDNRIAREAMFDAQGGWLGKLNLAGTSGDAGREAAVLLETGTDRFALHVDAFQRSSADVTVPVALACTKTGSPTLANRICNSAAWSRGGAVGGTAFFRDGYVGLSSSDYQSDYGTVAEDAVNIVMRSTRQSLAGEWRNLAGPLQSLKAQLNRTDYTHTEFDAGVAGTVFKNDGTDGRLEARHARLGPLDGVVGLQLENSQFSADGTEAFAPYSRTRQTALFVHEELVAPIGKLSFGGRWETVAVTSLGNPLVARFVPGERQFSPASYAFGATWNLMPSWQLSANWAYNERAPKDYELFADGPHIATHTYEVGNAGFQAEKSTQFDLGVTWKQGANRFGFSAFVNTFANYLALDATGVQRDTDGNGGNGVSVNDSGQGDNTSLESGGTAGILPEFAYTQVAARFTGLEAQGSLRLLEGAQTLDLELRADMVRAVNTATNQALSRIAPMRVGASLAWAQGSWGARLDVNHVAAQNEVPAGQLPTAAYTLANASLQYRQKAGGAQLLWFARLDNMGDTLAYSASSILTQTAPGKAPLPGRSLKLGVQAVF